MKERLSSEVIEQIDCMKVHLRNMQTVQEVAEVLKVDKNELEKGIAHLETAMVHFMNYEKLLKSKNLKEKIVKIDGNISKVFRDIMVSGGIKMEDFPFDLIKENESKMTKQQIFDIAMFAAKNSRQVMVELHTKVSPEIDAHIEGAVYNVSVKGGEKEYQFTFSSKHGSVVISSDCLDEIKKIKICE